MSEVPLTEAYRMLYPTVTILVTSIDKNKKPNIITLDWHMPVSFNPPIMAIAVGKSRYSHKLIDECGEFVVNVPTGDMKDKALFCGTTSGRNTDKFKEGKLTMINALKVKPPLIKECYGSIECRVIKGVDAGDHIIFVGKILAAHRNDEKSNVLVDKGNRSFVSFEK